MKDWIKKLFMEPSPEDRIEMLKEELEEKYEPLPDFLKKKVDKTCGEAPRGLVKQEVYLSWLEQKLNRVDSVWMGMYAAVGMIVVCVFGILFLVVKMIDVMMGVD